MMTAYGKRFTLMDCLSLQSKSWSMLDQVLQFELEPKDQPREEVEIAETSDNDMAASDRLELDDLISSVTLAADRKSTRLNSSHVSISYAVFCLKKKKNKKI